MFLGYDAYSTTSSDMVQVFDGTIDDIEFEIENNELNIILEGHKIPSTEIQGRKIDYRLKTINDIEIGSLSSLQSGQTDYIPVPFGRHEFSPGKVIGSNLTPSVDETTGNIIPSWWTYVFADETKLPSGCTYSAWQRPRWYTWYETNTPMCYIYNDDFYTPITKPSYNYRLGSYYRWFETRDATNEWWQVTFNPGQMNTGWNQPGITATDTFNNVLPYRPGASGYEYNVQTYNYDPSGYTTIYSDDGTGMVEADYWWYMFDGDANTRWRIDTDTVSIVPHYSLWLNTDGLDFYRNYTSEYIGTDWVLHMDQPIHVGNNPGADGGSEGIMTKEVTNEDEQYDGFILGFWDKTILTTHLGNINSFWVNHPGQPDTVVNYGINSVLGAEGKSGSETFDAQGRWSGSIPFGAFFNDWSEYESDYIDYEAWCISRESWVSFRPRIAIYPRSTIDYTWYEHIGFASRSQESFDYDNIYHAMQSPLVPAGTLLSCPVGSDHQMRKPYQYLEAIIRVAEDATDDDFTSNWDYTTQKTNWDNLFSTWRDYSGFVINEKTKLDEFMKKYLDKEPFTVYKNEYGKWDYIQVKETYTSGDVDYTVDFGDCSSFSVKYSSLDDVVWKINNLKTNYINGMDDYEQQYEWENIDSGYDTNFYGSDDERYTKDVIEKKYTSYSYPWKINYSGTTYAVIQPNLSRTFNAPDTAVGARYWLETDYDSSYPDWGLGKSYEQTRSEQHAIGNFILSQWGNRHRIVNFRTKNPDAYALQLGDIVKFSNVPYSCLGINFDGWNGAINTYATYNGQRIYPYFIVTSITKYQGYVELEVTGLHRLNEFDTKMSQAGYDRVTSNAVVRKSKNTLNKDVSKSVGRLL